MLKLIPRAVLVALILSGCAADSGPAGSEVEVSRSTDPGSIDSAEPSAPLELGTWSFMPIGEAPGGGSIVVEHLAASDDTFVAAGQLRSNNSRSRELWYSNDELWYSNDGVTWSRSDLGQQIDVQGQVFSLDGVWHSGDRFLALGGFGILSSGDRRSDEQKRIIGYESVDGGVSWQAIMKDRVDAPSPRFLLGSSGDVILSFEWDELGGIMLLVADHDNVGDWRVGELLDVGCSVFPMSVAGDLNSEIVGRMICVPGSGCERSLVSVLSIGPDGEVLERIEIEDFDASWDIAYSSGQMLANGFQPIGDTECWAESTFEGGYWVSDDEGQTWGERRLWPTEGAFESDGAQIEDMYAFGSSVVAVGNYLNDDSAMIPAIWRWRAELQDWEVHSFEPLSEETVPGPLAASSNTVIAATQSLGVTVGLYVNTAMVGPDPVQVVFE